VQGKGKVPNRLTKMDRNQIAGTEQKTRVSRSRTSERDEAQAEREENPTEGLSREREAPSQSGSTTKTSRVSFVVLNQANG
jgi:hypothetical protein